MPPTISPPTSITALLRLPMPAGGVGLVTVEGATEIPGHKAREREAAGPMPAQQGPSQEQEERGFEGCRRCCEGNQSKNYFRVFLRPPRLLRDVRAQHQIAVATLLLDGMPARHGASQGAGTAMEGGPSSIRTAGSAPGAKQQSPLFMREGISPARSS